MEELCKKQLKIAINNLQQQEVKYDNFFTNFYVKRKNSYNIHEVLSLFELSDDNITLLFSGQPGCGKTTDLRLLKELLEETHERENLVIFISLFLDGIYAKNLEYTDIIMGIFSEFLIQVYNKFDLSQEIISNLTELLKELDNENEIKKSIKKGKSVCKGFFELFKIKMNKSDHVREKFRLLIERKIIKILSLFDNILETLRVNEQMDQIVIIVDDLEKIVDEHVITNFLYNHGNLIKERRCSFIITINNNIHYDSKGEYALTQFRASFSLSFIPIKKNDGSYDENEINKVKEIIHRRVSKDLIDEKALELAIIYSGGNLSTLFRIYSMAINKVNFSNECKIKLEFVKEAFYDTRLRSDSINNKTLTQLRTIHHLKENYKEILEPEQLKEFIHTSILLTYGDPNEYNKQWLVLNPALYAEEELKEIEYKYEYD